jgi:hypothetical protein
MAAMDTAETVMDGGDTAVKPGVAPGKSTAVEPAGVEPTVETAAVETATMPSATMPSASVPSASASVGEIWLAENSRAQQRSCNTHHSPCLPGSGFPIF